MEVSTGDKARRFHRSRNSDAGVAAIRTRLECVRADLSGLAFAQDVNLTVYKG
jgi:hypothetical protein